MPTVDIDGPKGILVVAHYEGLKGIMVINQVADLDASFDVGQNSASLKAIFLPRYAASTNLKGIMVINQVADLKAILQITQWNDMKAVFVVNQHEDLKGIMTIRHSTSSTVFAKATIRHPDTEGLSAEFRITIEGWEMQGLTAGVYRDLGVIS